MADDIDKLMAKEGVIHEDAPDVDALMAKEGIGDGGDYSTPPHDDRQWEPVPDTSEKDRLGMTSDPVGATVKRAFNASLFGLGNKAMAAGYALSPDAGEKSTWSERYHNALSRSDTVDANDRKEYPVLGVVGDLAGTALASRLIPGGAPAGAGFLTSVGRAGVQGMGVGALNGFGSSRSDKGEDIASDIVDGSVFGGVTGMGLGALGYGASKGFSAVAKYLDAKKAEKAAEVLKNAGVGETPTLEANAGGQVASQSSAQAQAQGDIGHYDIEPTQVRQSRQAGHVNAAVNNAQSRLAGEAQVAQSADPEAARFMAGRSRSFNGARQSTPEYQNMGDLTKVSPRNEIAGASASAPERTAAVGPGDVFHEYENGLGRVNTPGRPNLPPGRMAVPVAPDKNGILIDRNTPDLHEIAYRDGQVVRIPGGYTEAERPVGSPSSSRAQQQRLGQTGPSGQATGDGVQTANIKAPVAPPAPPAPPRALESAPFNGPELGPEGGGYDRQSLLEQALKDPANNQGGSAWDIAKGAAEGMRKGGREAMYPSFAASLLGHHGIAEALELGDMGIRGAAGALGARSPAQQYGTVNNMSRAMSYLDGPEWRDSILKGVLGRTFSTRAEEQASNASVYDKKDPRRP